MPGCITARARVCRRHRALATRRPVAPLAAAHHPAKLPQCPPTPAPRPLALINATSAKRRPLPLVAALPAKFAPCPPTPQPRPLALIGATAAVVITGVVNRLLYKGALEAVGPKNTLFLALLQASAPAAAYCVILGARLATGAATRADLAAVNGWTAAVIGAGEAASSTLGFVAARSLPGAALPMLSQTMLIWQLAAERLLLGRQVPPRRALGAALVIAGVVAAATPRAGAVAAIPAGAAALFTAAQVFPAVAALAKQSIFECAQANLGRPLDVFALTARASVAQAAAVAAALPITATARGVPIAALPSYLADGFADLAGGLPGCPLLPGLYVCANVLFNIALITLLRLAGAFTYSVAAAAIVPAAIAAFAVPWPFLPPPPELGPYFVVGAVLLVAGLGVVTVAPVASRESGRQEAREPLLGDAGLEVA